MEIGIILGIIGILATIIFWYIPRQIKRRKKKGVAIDETGEHRLTDPSYLLGIRAKPEQGFNKYYYQREFDDEIAKRLDKHENILVIGQPLAGKTRAIYEALKKFSPAPEVIKPGIEEIRDEKFAVPEDIGPLDRVILLFDDIQKYTVRASFAFNLKKLNEKGIIIIATCRSGPEHEALCRELTEEMALFKNPINIGRITETQAEDVIREVGRQHVPDSFDGNIGSLFLPLDAMKERYAKASADEKKLLEALKRLYNAGVFRQNEIFSIDHLKTVCQHIGLKKSDAEWAGFVSSVSAKGFIDRIDDDAIRVEEVYLQQIIPGDFSSPAGLQKTSDIFPDDYDALFKIGGRAYELGDISLEKAHYKRLAVAIYRTCLHLRQLEKYPEDYAMTQNNLGTALQTLAQVDDKAANCRAAIAAYTEALTVYTLDRFPMDYAMTQNNLAIAFRNLGDIEDKADNCRKAIAAYTEALKVRTLDRFPMDYAMTQNNLGTALQTLADVDDKADNCRAAIAAYTEALTVYTLDRFPMDYAGTQNNLGTALQTLADVDDKADNCRAAIAAYTEALTVYTLDRFPMDYAMTQNNLGAALQTLAEVEDKAANCRDAIAAYTEAFKIRTLDRFPMQYAMTQFNLALVYITMASEGDKQGNCQKARDAFNEALKVYTPDKLPQYHQEVLRALEYLDEIRKQE